MKTDLRAYLAHVRGRMTMFKSEPYIHKFYESQENALILLITEKADKYITLVRDDWKDDMQIEWNARNQDRYRVAEAKYILALDILRAEEAAR